MNEKIMLYKLEKEKSRMLYRQTKDKSHLEDIFMLSQMIRIEEEKEGRRLSRCLMILTILTVLSPWILWMISELMK